MIRTHDKKKWIRGFVLEFVGTFKYHFSIQFFPCIQELFAYLTLECNAGIKSLKSCGLFAFKIKSSKAVTYPWQMSLGFVDKHVCCPLLIVMYCYYTNQSAALSWFDQFYHFNSTHVHCVATMSVYHV